MPSTILTNKFLSPVPTSAKVFETRKNAQGENEIEMSFPWKQHFRDAAAAINASLNFVQIQPTSSASKGTPQQAFLSVGFLYICVAKNHWQRVALSDF